MQETYCAVNKLYIIKSHDNEQTITYIKPCINNTHIKKLTNNTQTIHEQYN